LGALEPETQYTDLSPHLFCVDEVLEAEHQ
jgi:hypothetical protein